MINVNDAKLLFSYYRSHSSKRAIAHNFFDDIKYEIQAYILGLIITDGHVGALNYRLSYAASEKDAADIIPLFQVISPEARIERNLLPSKKSALRNRVVNTNYYFRIVI